MPNNNMKDIYNSERRLERTLQIVKASKKITMRNKKLLFSLLKDLKNQNMSIHRQVIYSQKLKTIMEDMKDIETMKTKDLVESFSSKVIDNGYSSGGVELFKEAINKLLHKLNREDTLEEIKKIKVKPNRHLPTLLNRDDFNKLITSVTGYRDKALIYLLYESGFRIGELLNIKIKDLEFTDIGIRINVSGKTGSRRILVIECQTFITNWLNEHPSANDVNSYLFVDKGGVRLNHPCVYRMLERTRKLAGIKKKTNPHIFRHSRATELAKHLTEFQLCQYFGWSVGSKTPRVYVHLSGKSIEEAILRVNNISPMKQNSEPISTIKKCFRCNEVNPPLNNFCYKCGLPLNTKSNNLIA